MDTSSTIQAKSVGLADTPTPPVTRIKEAFALVIFGATGDLTANKLMPALFRLWQDGFLGCPFVIVGVGRRDKDDARFRAELRAVVKKHTGTRPAGDDAWDQFATRLFYHRADITLSEGYLTLAERLRTLEEEHGLGGNRLYYLSTDPDHFPGIVEQLAGAGLVRRDAGLPWTRVVIEKPFGKDLKSALALDQKLLHFLSEEQVFRIDHYLGKETVQNLLAFRFGNALFDPVFNRRYVDHVQITMAETGGMEGRRGAFYDHAGALRDVVQNHLLQILALVAMEPPASLGAKDIRDEKVKVLRSLVPGHRTDIDRWVVRGQYGSGRLNDQPVTPYREEEAVEANSTTETYAALRLEVDTWRWAGVPFLLRTGKRLSRRVTEIAVEFKKPPLRLFTSLPREGDVCDRTCGCVGTCECAIGRAEPSVLVIRIQPEEGISLSFSAKRPGIELALEPAQMDFRFGGSNRQVLPEAYDRLLLDALRGEPTLFLRSDEVDAQWAFITPILEAWQSQPAPRFPNYAAGSWGPVEADRLVAGCHRGWRHP